MLPDPLDRVFAYLDLQRAHLVAALVSQPVAGVRAESAASQFHVVLQGGNLLASAAATPAQVAIDHLERYLRLLFNQTPDRHLPAGVRFESQ